MSTVVTGLVRSIPWKQTANHATKQAFKSEFGQKVVAQTNKLTKSLSLKNTAQTRGKGGTQSLTTKWRSTPYIQRRNYSQYFTPPKIHPQPGIISIKPPKTTLPIVYEGPVSNVDARGQGSKSLKDLAASTYRLRSGIEDLRDATDKQLPGLLKALGAMDEQGRVTKLGQAVIDHIDMGASKDPAILEQVQTLATHLAPPLVEAGMSNKAAGEKLAGRLLQACRNFANELARLPQLKPDAEKILEGLAQADQALQVILDSLGNGKSPSDEQVRAFYNVMNKQVSATIESAAAKALTKLTDLQPTTREKVNFAMAGSDIRSLTRHVARQLGGSNMMATATARDYLKTAHTQTPTGHGPRFHARINMAFMERGVTVDSALEGVRESSKRTNANVNARFDPKSVV